jgi:hypothetical protein
MSAASAASDRAHYAALLFLKHRSMGRDAISDRYGYDRNEEKGRSTIHTVWVGPLQVVDIMHRLHTSPVRIGVSQA